MAVAGSATRAYRMWMGDDGELKTHGTTSPRELCDKPHAAAGIIVGGGEALVAGSDAMEVRNLVKTGGSWGGLELKYVIVDDLPNVPKDTQEEEAE